MTYDEILDYLAIHWKKTALMAPVAGYDFAAFDRLLDAFDHPERKPVAYLHVTGSKGKGSTAYLAARLLRAHGVRTGLFTSPHLERVEERISANGRTIPPEAFAAELSAALAARERLTPDLGIFPCLIIAALTWYRRQGVEAAVVEVRSGGRFDPTNIIPARHQAVTAIEAEHMPGLGRTLAEIAWQKSGIIKPGSTVTSARQTPEVAAVIEAEANKQGAGLRRASADFDACPIAFDPAGTTLRYRTPAGRAGRVRLGLLGRHQVDNAAVAIAAVESLLTDLGRSLDPEHVGRALETAHWPARLDVVSEHPLIVYDGAHTPQSARSLADSLQAHFGPVRWQILLALLRTKDAAGICRALAPVAERVLTVPIPGFAARDAADLAAIAADQGLAAESYPSLATALTAARRRAAPIAVTGTLYLYGPARQACLPDDTLHFN